MIFLYICEGAQHLFNFAVRTHRHMVGVAMRMGDIVGLVGAVHKGGTDNFSLFSPSADLSSSMSTIQR